MTRPPRLLSSLLCLVFLLAGCSRSGEPIGVEDVEGPFTWGAASNVTHVRHLYFSAQPDEATLKAAREAAVGVVIDLRAEGERDWNEEQAATGLGMRYYRVPVPEKEPFSAEAFARIDALVEQHDDEQILIHCSTGNRATGWFATHLVKKHGMEFDDAIVVARKAGITKDEIVEKVTRFLGEPVPAAAAE